ncbi:MAG TPA: hypothetical protein VGL94_02565 [Ktedonobacteraceae bacterium]|jgi:hypothetical protein
MSTRKQGSRETRLSEVSDRGHAPSSSRGWSMEQHGTHTRDTASKAGRTLEFLKECEKIIRVIDTLDAAASKGKDQFQRYLLANNDQLQKMITGLKENKPEVLNYFHRVVQTKDSAWEPLKNLTEQVMSGGDSTPSTSRTRGSDVSRSTTPTQGDHLSSPPTISTDSNVLLNSMLIDMKSTMESPDYSTEKEKNIILTMNRSRINNPNGFKYIDRTIQAKLSSDESWQPIKEIVEQVKREYVDTMLQEISNSASAGFPQRDRFPIVRDILVLKRVDREGFERFERQVQENLRSNSDWQPIKDMVDLVKARNASSDSGGVIV